MAKRMGKLIATLYEVSSGKFYDISEYEDGEIWATGSSLLSPIWLSDNLQDFQDSSYCVSSSYRVKWIEKKGLAAFLERTG